MYKYILMIVIPLISLNVWGIEYQYKQISENNNFPTIKNEKLEINEKLKKEILKDNLLKRKFHDKLNLNYSNNFLLIKINKNDNKSNNKLLFIDALSPGEMIVFDSNFNYIDSYGISRHKGKTFYPIFNTNKIKTNSFYILRKSNLRFDGVLDYIDNEKNRYYDNYNTIMTFLFLGSALFLILYHLGNYIVTKNKNFLYYIVFNTSYIFIVGTFCLSFYRYLGYNFIEETLMSFAGLTAMLSSLFARKFLDFDLYISKKNIFRIKIIEKILFILSFIHLATSPIKPIVASLIDVMVVVSIFHSIYFAYKVRKLNIMSYFYLVSWLFLFTGVFFLYTYEYTNLFNEHFAIRYSLMIGCLLEMIINSFGLGYKMKILEKEKMLAELKARENKKYKKLLRIICHDLSNPLTSGFMSLDFLRKNLEKIEYEGVKYVDYTEKSLKRISDIIEEVREQEKENNNKEYLNLKEAHNIILSNFELKLKEKNITLLTKGEINTMIPIGKNELINNILANMISNAIKFSKENSKIILKLVNNGENIELSCIDYGSGMPKDIIDKINNGICVSTSGTKGETGTGLGTQIMKEIAEEHCGEFKIFSKLNKGTEILLTIPKLIEVK